jgi:Uma2 family endonuclease
LATNLRDGAGSHLPAVRRALYSEIGKEVPMAEPAYLRRDLPENPPLPERKDGRPWPVQGEWTYADYGEIPDDGQWYEVLYGVLFVTPAPRYRHQAAVWRLGPRLALFVEEGDLGEVLGAPFDVELPWGISSPVQPDILFFRNGNRPRREDARFAGVPDLVVEVLSPKTAERDRTIKLEAYRQAGVPEYWMVDPDACTLEVYILAGHRYVELCRGGIGEVVWSAVVPGFRVEVKALFPPGAE